MNESTSLALMIAAVCEAILLRPYARALWAWTLREALLPRSQATRDAARQPVRPVRHVLHNELDRPAGQRLRSIEDLLRHVEATLPPLPHSRRTPAPASLVRQTLALSALAGAYLQYYFLEVNLQIASLNALTIFVTVSSTT